MPHSHQQKTPGKGINALREYWANDLIAAISVALVALPLSLGIALAAGVPPISGVLASIVGGVITTLYRGSHVVINGPAAGMIAVILAGISAMDDGSGRVFNYVLGAIVVAGGLKVILGLLRAGRLAYIFPSSVINGILAAIGIIILSKQLHVALGTQTEATNTVDILLDVFYQLPEINPFVAVISVTGLLILIFHSRINNRLLHLLPAPMWVLLVSVPFAYWFNFFDPHTESLFGSLYAVGPDMLINIPDNLIDSLMFPDFSQIHTPAFWITALSITIISSIETLASVTAIDKLDPFRRKSKLNRELVGVGLATVGSGLLGGFPVTSVIVRSSVNITNNAKTKWSNFFHGIILLVFILLLTPLIKKVPLAALATILVYTGFRLASPKVFAKAYEQGMEQLLFLSGTLIITLFTNLLWGILGGILLTLIIHILLARLPLPTFMRLALRSNSDLQQGEDGRYDLNISGIANFLSLLRMEQTLSGIPAGASVRTDLSKAQLVDLSVLERLHDLKRDLDKNGGSVMIEGLEQHMASSGHPLALKSLPTTASRPMSARERDLRALAGEKDWAFSARVEWEVSYLQHFRFFDTRPIERKTNVINGRYPLQQVAWEISDITFDEGALQAREVYHTTVLVLRLPFGIPTFILEEEGFLDKIFDRVLHLSSHRDIDLDLFPDFSNKFLLRGDDEEAVRGFFHDSLIRFLEQEEDIYHVESNGEALLVFRYLRLARGEEITRMVRFAEILLQQLQPPVGLAPVTEDPGV